MRPAEEFAAGWRETGSADAWSAIAVAAYIVKRYGLPPDALLWLSSLAHHAQMVGFADALAKHWTDEAATAAKEAA